MVLGNTRSKSQTYRLLLGLYVCCCECIFAITLESQFKIYHMESLVPSNPLLNRWHRQCGRYSTFFTFIPGVIFDFIKLILHSLHVFMIVFAPIGFIVPIVVFIGSYAMIQIFLFFFLCVRVNTASIRQHTFRVICIRSVMSLSPIIVILVLILILHPFPLPNNIFRDILSFWKIQRIGTIILLLLLVAILVLGFDTINCFCLAGFHCIDLQKRDLFNLIPIQCKFVDVNLTFLQLLCIFPLSSHLKDCCFVLCFIVQIVDGSLAAKRTFLGFPNRLFSAISTFFTQQLTKKR
ncbi:unnamed protein product [Albugo candida]|uniref:Uncharacterized protein n=1 Tax=Albugo candida TaxID=65357 RepID=A0A024FXZ3_9STRA|nr:unnamed protein product [Albugo candida]|eukprot:CCI11509.1 unnamed protein product [Albugo candida]